VSDTVTYLLAGPRRSAVAELLRSRLDGCVVLETDAPPSQLGDLRTEIAGRPCHVVVLAGGDYDDGGPRVGLWLDGDPESVVEEIVALTTAPRKQLVVSEYDARWPERFEEIAQRIAPALGAVVEHVGSTAVPGLAAKPIVDVDVVVRSPDDVPSAIEGLRALGYVYQGDKGIRGREAFLWPPGAEPHHVYVVVAGSAPYVDHVDFRDYLRAHPEVADEYAALKRDLAARHADDSLRYTEAKTEFVTGVLRQARGSPAP
jgi:GrpB-like predicted nucleotidyltransferase (UPF0157 family)